MNREKIAQHTYTLAFISMVVLWASLAFSPALVEIATVVGIIAWLMWKGSLSQPLFNIPRIIWLPLAIFLFFSALSVVFSEYPAKSFRGIFKILQQLSVFILVADVFSLDSKRRLFEKILLFTALVVLVDGVFQYITGIDFLRHHAAEASGAGIRLTAGFGNYGKFAAYLVCVIPFLLGLSLFYKTQTQGKRWFYLSLALALGFCFLLFLTRSRGAFLGFLGGSFLTLLFIKKYRLILMLLFITLLSLPLLPHNMIIHLDAEKKEQSVVERYYLWDRAIHVIKAKPLTGTGINTYAVAHQRYDSTNNWRVRNYYAHNGYLQMAAETGIPCLFAFFWFFVTLLRCGFKESSSREKWISIGLLTALLNFSIFAAVDTLFHNAQPAIMFWFICGLQVAYQGARKIKLDAA